MYGRVSDPRSIITPAAAIPTRLARMNDENTQP